MKCYTDLDGKIEAKPGDRVALIISESGETLRQSEESKRPRLSDDGSGPVFDAPSYEGGPFMVLLDE